MLPRGGGDPLGNGPVQGEELAGSRTNAANRSPPRSVCSNAVNTALLQPAALRPNGPCNGTDHRVMAGHEASLPHTAVDTVIPMTRGGDKLHTVCGCVRAWRRIAGQRLTSREITGSEATGPNSADSAPPRQRPPGSPAERQRKIQRGRGRHTYRSRLPSTPLRDVGSRGRRIVAIAGGQ